MKIYKRNPKVRISVSSVKFASIHVGKLTGSIREAGSGRGSLSALQVKGPAEEGQEREKKKSERLPEFDRQVMRLLKPKEYKKYKNLPNRIRKKFVPDHPGSRSKGAAIKTGTAVPAGASPPDPVSALSFSPGTTGMAGPSAAGSGGASGSAGAVASGTGAGTSAAVSMTSSSAATSAAGASGAAASSATATAAVTSTTTAAVTTTAAAATSAATAGATAGAFAVAEGAKATKKAAEKIQKALKDSAKMQKAREAALEEEHKKTSDGKTKLAGAGGALQEFMESFKRVAGMAVGSFVSSILSLLLSVAALPILLIAVLAVVLISAILGTSGTGNTQIVAVAQAEEQAWEENIGGYKYKNWYGMDADWCAMFVSWCADQCGFIDSGLFVKSASVPVIRNFYESTGDFYRKGDYEPKPGDLIIYGATGGDHIGIVTGYDSTAKIITTIEGNTGASSTDTYHEGSRVREKQVSMAYGWIYGFCSPDYPIDVGELVGGTYTEQAFNYFLTLGYTPQASAGIVGNLLQETGFEPNGDMAIHTTGDGGAVGIAMWTYPSIRSGFLDYAKAQGEPWPDTSLKVQLDYLVMTMGQPTIWMFNSYSGRHFPAEANMTLEEYKRCTDVALATTAFCACYERPDHSAAMLDQRIRYAQSVYERYGNKQ